MNVPLLFICFYFFIHYIFLYFLLTIKAQIKEAKVKKIKKEKAKSGAEFNREEVEAAIDAEDAKDTNIKKIVNPKIIRLKVRTLLAAYSTLFLAWGLTLFSFSSIARFTLLMNEWRAGINFFSVNKWSLIKLTL